MLLKTTAEVKQLLPRLLAHLNNNALMPNLARAEQKYLVPLIGPELYQEFIGLYNAGTLVAPDARLQVLKNMQLVSATHAFLDELALNIATITDNGVRSATTANMPKVYGWEFKALKAALQDAAADSVDVLLASLVINKAGLPKWVASEAYQHFNAGLIRTAAQFNAIHRLHQPQRTFYAIKTLMLDAQEQKIQQAIGSALVDYFTTADAPVLNKMLERTCLIMLQKALAFFTILKACEHYAVQITDAGFTVLAGGDPEGETAGKSATAGANLLQLKMDACKRDGEAYLSKAKQELAKLAADGDAPAAFLTAYNAGPLKTNGTGLVDKGNGHRSFFRF